MCCRTRWFYSYETSASKGVRTYRVPKKIAHPQIVGKGVSHIHHHSHISCTEPFHKDWTRFFIPKQTWSLTLFCYQVLKKV